MSIAIVLSRDQVGVQAPAVTVETHLANGLPSLTLVGLPEGALSNRINKTFKKNDVTQKGITPFKFNLR